MPIKIDSTRKITKAFLFGLILISPFSTAAADWAVPSELTDKVDLLSESEQAFLRSGNAFDFLPQQQLEHELASRDESSLKQFMSGLMSLAAEMGYNENEDMGAIPLNLASKRFNSGVPPTHEALRETEREPGPFSVHRYQFPESGVPTFAGARVAIWPEDLVAGKVDVAIVGVPSNLSSGRRDARWGPNTLRALDTMATPDIHSLVDPTEALNIVDYGDFNVDNMGAFRTVDHVTQMIKETAATGAVPMMVGGDTSVLYPGVKGVAQAHESAEIGLLHFSAHPNADRAEVHRISDRQALFMLIDEDIVSGANIIHVGMRGASVTPQTLQWLRSQQVRYHTMAEVHKSGWDKVLRRIEREVDKGPDRFFVSVDVSVIEPAEMVAAGRIESNGLRVRQLTQLLRQVCAKKDIAGFEITDLAPMLDYSRLSAVNANAVLNACLVGMAMNKVGLAPDYIHPLAADHGQR